jgi:hypothetical protein
MASYTAFIGRSPAILRKSPVVEERSTTSVAPRALRWSAWLEEEVVMILLKPERRASWIALPRWGRKGSQVTIS